VAHLGDEVIHIIHLDIGSCSTENLIWHTVVHVADIRLIPFRSLVDHSPALGRH